MAGAGEGSRDAMVGVLGMLAGAAVFVAGYNVLEPAGLLLGDWGKVTLPEVLGVSPWAIVAALAIGVPVLFWLLKPHEGRVRDAYCARAPERRRRIRSAGDRRPAWGTPVAGG